MKSILPLAAVALCLLSASVGATVKEGVESAAEATGKGVVKVDKAVGRGVKAGADGLEHGAKAGGEAVKKGAKKVGLPSGPPASSPKRMPH